MEIENAKITFIGDVQKSKSGREAIKVKMEMPNSGGRVDEFVVLQNTRNPRFDLIKQFKREVFKVGQTVGFSYNKAQEDWQSDVIWKLKIRDNEVL